MSATIDTHQEAVFQAVLSELRTKAPLMHNMWAVLGRGVPRSTTYLATVLWSPETPPPEARFQQMRVGAFMAHINKRIARRGLIIKPGAARSTYQLYNLATWEHDQDAARSALAREPVGHPPLAIRRAKKNRP